MLLLKESKVKTFIRNELAEEDDDIIKSNRFKMFFKIGVFKNFTIFTGKHLCWSLFLMMSFRPANLLKRNFNTGVFPLILRIF